jgi:hypothetical protein
MKNFEHWRDELLAQIEYQKSKGRHSYYCMSNKMSQSTQQELDGYFKVNGYHIELRRCSRGLVDIMITDF